MKTAVLLLAISSVLLSLIAIIDDFRRTKKENWFEKKSEPEENYLPLSKSHTAE